MSEVEIKLFIGLIILLGMIGMGVGLAGSRIVLEPGPEGKIACSGGFIALGILSLAQMIISLALCMLCYQI